MLKPFYITSMLLAFLVMGVLYHANRFDRDSHLTTLQLMSKLSHLQTLSFSTSEYEPRMRLYDEATNICYPELLPIDTMSYVYE
jgi:hypothetical protein